MDNLAWLGLLGDDPLPATANTLMDVLTGRMLQLMVYQPGERDLIVLYDVFYARYSDRTERTTSTLVAFGIPNGDSAMARTVSLPAAIGVRLILNGKITARGVHVPVIPEIYNPVLDELEALGIRCVEETTVVPS
jgi:saccharopine dehydrogenase-like NADP-dependent oxidoreductase